VPLTRVPRNVCIFVSLKEEPTRIYRDGRGDRRNLACMQIVHVLERLHWVRVETWRYESGREDLWHHRIRILAAVIAIVLIGYNICPPGLYSLLVERILALCGYTVDVTWSLFMVAISVNVVREPCHRWRSRPGKQARAISSTNILLTALRQLALSSRGRPTSDAIPGNLLLTSSDVAECLGSNGLAGVLLSLSCWPSLGRLCFPCELALGRSDGADGRGV
jgi:hypothetical protein